MNEIKKSMKKEILIITSESHLDMTIDLIKSLDVKPIVIRLEKYNGSDWGTYTFNMFMKQRIKIIIEELKKTDVLFFLDTDILLFEKTDWFFEQLKDNDIVFQKEPDGTICMGLFVMKNNIKTVNLLEHVYQYLDGTDNDEVLVNRLIKNHDVQYDFFDEDEVITAGHILKRQIYSGHDIDVPKNMKAFHANYCIGVFAKRELLDKAKKQYENNGRITDTR